MSVGGGSWSLGHRAELDGLRGLAVIAVMLGHGYVRGFEGGGAVGVAVFFTLSGFLITALLLEERNETGRISTRSFWRRRAVRLLPALAVVMLVFLILPVTSSRPNGVEVLGILGYVGNWFRVAGHGLDPFNHTWSLAVEEQFYVAWPLVVIVVMRWVPRWLPAMILGMAGASVMIRWWFDATSPGQIERVMFGSDTNAVCMLGGCLLAVLMVGGHTLVVRRWVAVVAAVMLAVLCGVLGPWITDLRYLHEGSMHVVWLPVLVTLFTIPLIARLATEGGSVMRWSPLVYVGTISYGLYLWHVPIFHAFEHFEGPANGPARWVPVFVMSWVCADLSLRFVERPIIRRWKHTRPRTDGAIVNPLTPWDTTDLTTEPLGTPASRSDCS